MVTFGRQKDHNSLSPSTKAPSSGRRADDDDDDDDPHPSPPSPPNVSPISTANRSPLRAPAVCTSVESCPALPAPPGGGGGGGGTIPASSCTSGSMRPAKAEEPIGKRYHCECGGDDASTQWVCKQQVGTALDIYMLPSNDTFDWSRRKAHMSIIERAGTPSQVGAPHPRSLLQPNIVDVDVARPAWHLSRLSRRSRAALRCLMLPSSGLYLLCSSGLCLQHFGSILLMSRLTKPACCPNKLPRKQACRLLHQPPDTHTLSPLFSPPKHPPTTTNAAATVSAAAAGQVALPRARQGLLHAGALQIRVLRRLGRHARGVRLGDGALHVPPSRCVLNVLSPVCCTAVSC